MKYNVDELVKVCNKLKENAYLLCQAHQCEWYDDVHASYGCYANSTRTGGEEAIGFASRLRDVCTSLNALKIDETIATADSLINQIGSI